MLNRTIQLNIRVTQEEKQRFEQAAKAADCLCPAMCGCG